MRTEDGGWPLWTTVRFGLTAALVFFSLRLGVAHAAASEDGTEDLPANVEVEIEEPVLVNAVSVGAAYAYHILRNRTDAETGEPLGKREQLFGFVLEYSRHVVPERLAITFAKPFLFNKERVDTPFDFILRGLYRRNRWELFAGLLVTWNIRVFEREREEKEGERNALSFGFGLVLGGAYFLNRRWSLDAEVGYTYVPTADIVTHEINAALTGVYHFGGLIERRRANRGSL